MVIALAGPDGDGLCGRDVGPRAEPLLALVVDDEPAIRALACRVLQHAGFACHYLATSHEALRGLRRFGAAVSLLLTDVSIEYETAGLELARFASFSDPDLPVIVMSGDVDSLRGAAGIPSVVAVLEKPFVAAELVRVAVATARRGRPPLPKRSIRVLGYDEPVS